MSNSPLETTRSSGATQARLLEAARDVIRNKGYAATTVDDICAAAGVSKGSFFHHYDSKEALVRGAIGEFDRMATALFAAAPYRAHGDPRERLFGYVDFRESLLDGEIAQYTCLLGTTLQEVHATHPELRAACDQAISKHVMDLVPDIAAAKKAYAPSARWTPDSVGYFMQSVLQGAFILAKAKQSPEIARECLRHLRRYLEHLFGSPRTKRSKETRR